MTTHEPAPWRRGDRVERFMPKRPDVPAQPGRIKNVKRTEVYVVADDGTWRCGVEFANPAATWQIRRRSEQASMTESTIPPFTEQSAAKLAHLERDLAQEPVDPTLGPRDTHLGNQAAILRLERDYVTLTLVVPRSAAEAFEESSVPHFDTNEVMFWTAEAGVSDMAYDAGADPDMWA